MGGALLPAGVTEFFKRRLCEGTGLLLIAIGCALMASLLSYSASDPSFNNATNLPVQNLLGSMGAITADIALQTFGIAAALPAITLVAWGLRLFAKQPIKHASIRIILLIASILLAAKFDIPVCPHAGGVGLCEHVQHFSAFDYFCVSGSLERRITEFADHLHEHFVHPVSMRDGHYVLPSAPGLGVEFKAASLDRYSYPDGPVWRERTNILKVDKE